MIRRIVDGPPDESGNPTDWLGLWLAYNARTGAGAIPFEALTLTQLRAWLADGDPLVGIDQGDDWQRKARIRAAFWAEIHESDPPTIEATTL